ncbi:CD225/dispanin family protein [Nocardiopsis changdeensis]|uniref:CD225/dispanin family protein n=1 Tax=Nocardiopsis changdeensis TaxID=2831969 RepID=A0ABX8BGN4_9ACTN|nr:MULTISPECIES: CD225/dispanin family protein [Nocardiopsis]QUX21234.1 CD225/dispanin family protein [Nocardiopsis changdeensis]QYX37165.1 CD225/dispanin family protein [Nocardiopsis sp. MT53]
MSYGPPPPAGPPGPGGYGPPPGGGGYGPPPGATPPDNGLVWAIVAIFCCWPFAIPALINATKVNDLWNRGDQAGAMQAQAQAKKWTKWAFISAGIMWALIILWYILMFVVFGAMAASTSSYSY